MDFLIGILMSVSVLPMYLLFSVMGNALAGPKVNLNNPDPGLVLIGILAWIVIFLVVREIFCWYWKINEIKSLLERIEENTRKTNPISATKTEATVSSPQKE